MNQAVSISTTTALPVVTLVDGKPVVDSRDVAARFGKRHGDVLRSIDLLLATAPACERNFASTSGPTPMPNGGARDERFFLVDRDGFALLAMGFTGSKAMAWKLDYIAAFNLMEEELRRRQAPAVDLNDPASLRTLLLGYSEQLIAAKAEVAETRQALVVTEKRAAFAEAVIEEVKPKVDAFHAFLSDDGLCNLRTAARACDAPSQLFIDWLQDKGYVFRENGDLQPSAAMRRDGYMKLRAGPDAVGKLRNQAMVTRGGCSGFSSAGTSAPAGCSPSRPRRPKGRVASTSDPLQGMRSETDFATFWARPPRGDRAFPLPPPEPERWMAPGVSRRRRRRPARDRTAPAPPRASGPRSVPGRRQRLVVELGRGRRGRLGGAAQGRQQVEAQRLRHQHGIPDVRRRAGLQVADDALGDAGLDGEAPHRHAPGRPLPGDDIPDVAAAPGGLGGRVLLVRHLGVVYGLVVDGEAHGGLRGLRQPRLRGG